MFETRRANLGEELVVEDLIQGESVAGGFLQDAGDEFLCSRGERRRQMVADFLDALVRLFQVQRLKRWTPTHQRVPARGKVETHKRTT